MSTDIAQGLAEFTTRTRYEDIPAGTVEFTKGLCLKTVAGMIRGATMPAGLKAIQSTRTRAHARMRTLARWPLATCHVSARARSISASYSGGAMKSSATRGAAAAAAARTRSGNGQPAPPSLRERSRAGHGQHGSGHSSRHGF